MDYNNARIYKIISDETDKVYIGSTCSPLSKRLYEHKSQYKRYLEGKFHRLSSFELIELGPVQIILVESYPCNSKEELEARERHYINENKNIVVNKVHPTRTKQEWYNDNKEELLKQMKEYYIANKEDKLKYQKEWYNDNKEDIQKYKKEYQLKNKDKLQAKNDCICGGNYTTAHKSQHLKSVKHQSYIKDQESKQIKLSQHSFDFIFKCDSLMMLPKTYTNIIITN